MTYCFISLCTLRNNLETIKILTLKYTLRKVTNIKRIQYFKKKLEGCNLKPDIAHDII